MLLTNTNGNFRKSIAFLALGTIFLLLIPFVAMQFTNEVRWTFSDFIFAGLLIFGSGLAYKLITMKSRQTIYRIAIGLALFSGIFLIWANAAVGIIDSENNEINMLYFIVVAIGIVGVFIAQFKPKGMMFTLFAMAAAQAMVAVIALFSGMVELPHSSVTEIIAVNGFFIMLFVVSALLFRYAGKNQAITSKA